MPFQFKQFEVADEQSSMRVGTDAVLLGAWADVENAHTILDIGTGCGIIALMLAQRNADGIVTAIDKDIDSINQAQINFANSAWSKHLQALHINFIEFHKNHPKKFDLIVSNPPFFSQSLKPECATRSTARHNDSLPFDILAIGVSQLLNPQGKSAFILPVSESSLFKEKMQQAGLYCNRQTWVSHTSKHKPVRLLMEFSFNDKVLQENYLTIRDEEQQFTNNYRKLTQDFHPFF